MPLVISFVGASGVGKTTVIEQLIPLVAVSGLRVGTVKHASHGHEVDRIGSDSWRHRRAGAEVVLLAGASGAVVFLAEQPEVALATSPHHTVGDGAVIELSTGSSKLISSAPMWCWPRASLQFTNCSSLSSVWGSVEGAGRAAQRGWPSRMPRAATTSTDSTSSTRWQLESSTRFGAEPPASDAHGTYGLANPLRVFDCET